MVCKWKDKNLLLTRQEISSYCPLPLPLPQWVHPSSKPLQPKQQNKRKKKKEKGEFCWHQTKTQRRQGNKTAILKYTFPLLKYSLCWNECLDTKMWQLYFCKQKKNPCWHEIIIFWWTRIKIYWLVQVTTYKN